MLDLIDKQKTSKTVFDLHPKIKENYITLRDRLVLSYNLRGERLQALSITSCHKGEGVTTVAVNLSIVLSRHGSVLLVDADSASIGVHKALKRFLSDEALDNQTGLTHVAHNFDLLSIHDLAPEDQDMFDSPLKSAELLNTYKQSYDYVIFDTPALGQGSASLRIGRLCDGVLLVVEAERTRRESLIRAKEQFSQIGAEVLGVVLNKRRLHLPRPFYRK